MTKPNKHPRVQCYTPSTTLKKYLEDRLQYEKGDKDLGTIPNSRMYTYVLNKILFPSMANIVYFLEQVAKHRELQGVFDDDIKELFGLKTQSNRKDRDRSIVQRLIEAMFYWDDGKQDNFRLEMIEIAQGRISKRLGDLAHLRLSESGFELIGHDVTRAHAWAELLAAKQQEAKDEKLKRPALF